MTMHMRKMIAEGLAVGALVAFAFVIMLML